MKLGDRTLVEHVRAIVSTEETKDLVRGTKERVGDLVDQAGNGVVKDVARRTPGKVTMRGDDNPVPGAVPRSPRQPPQEQLSPEDRKALRRMIGQGQLKPRE